MQKKNQQEYHTMLVWYLLIQHLTQTHAFTSKNFGANIYHNILHDIHTQDNWINNTSIQIMSHIYSSYFTYLFNQFPSYLLHYNLFKSISLIFTNLFEYSLVRQKSYFLSAWILKYVKKSGCKKVNRILVSLLNITISFKRNVSKMC